LSQLCCTASGSLAILKQKPEVTRNIDGAMKKVQTTQADTSGCFGELLQVAEQLL
jgi:hypothetical protein